MFLSFCTARFYYYWLHVFNCALCSRHMFPYPWRDITQYWVGALLEEEEEELTDTLEVFMQLIPCGTCYKHFGHSTFRSKEKVSVTTSTQYKDSYTAIPQNMLDNSEITTIFDRLKYSIKPTKSPFKWPINNYNFTAQLLISASVTRQNEEYLY